MKNAGLFLRRAFYTSVLLVQAFFVFSQAPTTQASNIIFSGSGGGARQLNWTNGNGARRLVVAYAVINNGGCINNIVTPANGTQYIANSTFGNGPVPSSICLAYAVYDGTGNTVSVSGLNTDAYVFQVFEYNGAGATTEYNTQMSSTISSGSNPNSITMSATNSDQCAQVSAISFGSAGFSSSTYSLGVGFTATSGSVKGVLMIGNTSTPHPSGLTFSPSRYCGNTNYGSGPTLGSNSYALFEYATAGGGGGGGCSIAATSTTITGLAANTLYYFQAFAWNGTSNSPVYNVAPGIGNYATFYTGPGTTAKNIIFSGLSSSQATLSWTNGNGSSRIIIADTNPISTLPSNGTVYTANSNYSQGTAVGTGYVIYNGSGSSTTISNLSGGTTYYFRIFEYNSSGSSVGNIYLTSTDIANPASQITAPDAPVPSAASSITQTSFFANWSASTGATQYFLDVSSSNTFSTFITGYNNLNVSNVQTYQVNTNLQAGQTYYYRVRASNASGTSGSSNTTSVLMIPPTPVATSASNISQTSFTANWDLIPNATYLIWLSTDPSFISGNIELSAKSISTNSYAITGLNPGTIYYYIIAAINGSGTSPSSNVISALTIPPDPVATSPVSLTSSSFTANWNASTTATAYRIDVATDAGFTSFVSGFNNLSVAGTSQLVTGLSANTTYFYRVRSLNTSGTSSNSNIITQTTLTQAPVATAASAITTTSFTANWGTVTGATGYKIDVATDAAFTSFVSGYNDLSVAGTSSSISGLSKGTTYYYRIRSVNAGGASVNSNTISGLTIPDAPVASAPTLIATSSFTANWNAVNGAADYRFDVSTDNFTTFLSSYNNLQVTGTAQSISGLSAGVAYQYRVRASNTSGVSINSNVISVVTIPSVPAAQPATSISTSGFTANWNAVQGTTDYLLFVSSDNFSSFLTGYNGKSISTTAEILTGLQSNSAYQYRVRANNSSGPSANSGSVSVLTLPSSPTNPNVTLITQTGFTANWTAVSGITEYLLDVSENNFTASNVPGYDNLLVTGITKPVTGLLSGVTYYFRVRAKNTTGVSANSNIISVLLLPANPVASPASGIGQNGLTANWQPVAGADNYLLDVSDNSGFTSLLTGYNAKSIPPNQTSEVIGSLQAGTLYYYRIKAVNSSGQSGYSNVVSQITIPAIPVLDPPQQITSSSFLASWQSVAGASSYELDVYSSNDNFVTLVFVSGYQSNPVFDGTDAAVVGLSPQTQYRFRVKSKNAGGISGNSLHKSVLTLKSDGTILNPPSIAAGPSTQSNTVKANITGGISPWSIVLYHKKITESGSVFVPELPVQSSTSPVDFQIAQFMDELGIEYYFKVTDDGGRESLSTTAKYMISFDSNVKTFLEGNFAGNRSSIKIISVPYVLNNNSVETLFGSLGVYDKKTWRLAHYRNKRNIEYQTPGFPAIERGVGFWFNAKVDGIDLKTPAGNVGTNDQSTPFQLELAEGWNQIGNPYPFPVDWSDVLADNPSKTGVSNLKIYEGSIQNFANSDDLKTFEGGFVHTDNAVTLDLKVTLRNTFISGGRKKKTENFDLGNPDWQVALSIKQGNTSTNLSGFGMHPDASTSKDKFDDIRLPRFDEFLDVTFNHPEYKFPNFSKDVVPTAGGHTWSFAIESTNVNENTLIEWDNTKFGENDAQLFLLDISSAELINMRKKSSFIFNGLEKREFKVYFSREGEKFSPGIMLIGKPYPNPTSGEVNINLVLPDAQQLYHVELIAYDHTGKPVKQLLNENLMGSTHLIQWDANDASGNKLPAGFYFLRATINEKNITGAHRLLLKN